MNEIEHFKTAYRALVEAAAEAEPNSSDRAREILSNLINAHAEMMAITGLTGVPVAEHFATVQEAALQVQREYQLERNHEVRR